MEANAEGRPAALWLSGRRSAVEEVLETWRIDDEWWRERPVSRMYFSLSLVDGRVMTVFRDEIKGRWWEQRYDGMRYGVRRLPQRRSDVSK